MKTFKDPICEREIRTRLENLRPDAARRWGVMTAGQMICHLNDAFLGVMGKRPMAIPKGFSPWQLSKPFALYVPMKWPKGVPTRYEFDQRRGGTPPSDFPADMTRLVAAINAFLEQPRSFQFQPHPLFGVMSEWEWMRWAYLHTDHHLRQFGV